MNNWKIGAVAGLIAGLVAGIVYSFSANTAAFLGFWEPQWREFYLNNYGANILVSIIWGVILGIIYSKAYRLIPGKGVLKGLCFGLVLLSISELRISTFRIAYGWILDVAGLIFTGFFKWIAYGLVLGFLHESLHQKYNIPKEKKKIIQYDMMSGLHPGAIAGLIGGMVCSITTILGPILGVFKIPGTLFELWLGQVGSHILVNLIWGTIFGAIFVRVYNLVPGKGIMKGFYYSFIVISISTFRLGFYDIGHGIIWSALWGFFVGFFNIIAYGLVLGLLYRKPTEIPAVKKGKIQVVRMVSCRHCNASIVKGSKYCNKCAKKQ